jgi:putative nucleotidyltransferase with HDIG domain
MTSAELAIAGFEQNQPIALPELISALTFALDLTEGAMPGHSLRCCLLGMRLAKALDLSSPDQTSLYYALLLKDIGCSSNASRMTQVTGGDDRAVKGIAKLTDWTSILRSSSPRTIRCLWKEVLPEASPFARAARIASLGVHQRENNRVMVELRCERGSRIVRKLRMGEATAEAVLRLDEHWDGSGYPDALCGESIPLISRICSIAQNLDIFASIDGQDAAVALLRRRHGTWFDPELVETATRLHRSHELWQSCTPGDSVETTRQTVMDIEPEASDPLLPEHIDTLCEGFADVIDAKSPFTCRHSLHVYEIAAAVAEALQLSRERQKMLRRAALLHDLGKLSVPNTILDKTGPLTGHEWDVVRRHPLLTQSILERISSFREIAVVAAEHHEKLDGSGYPCCLRARDMTLESRILAISDQFAGMTERRPYHPGYEAPAALELLRKSVPAKLDPQSFAALESLVGVFGSLTPSPDLTLEVA